MQGNLARVEHWNGFIATGLVTGGDGAGIYVQEATPPGGRERGMPVYCDFRNVRSITFNAAVES